MKVQGINKCYSVEIEPLGKGIAINLSSIDGHMMGVIVSKEDWEKLKQIGEGK